MFLQRCPHCWSEPQVRKIKNKYVVECGGDCWEQTHKYWELEDAVKEWNSLKHEEYEDDES